MSKKIIGLLSGSVLVACLVALPARAADDDAPKHKIGDVMKKAFKGPLLKKVAKGEASKDEAKQLHAMLESMAKSKPPKGDAESWKKLTSALVKASKDLQDGGDDAASALQKAANCKACHSKHKP